PLSFFLNDTPTTAISTLSLHDALPIYHGHDAGRTLERPEHGPPSCRRAHDREPLRQVAAAPYVAGDLAVHGVRDRPRELPRAVEDRKSTRLNSSHRTISYAVFCLKKKK